MLQSIHDKLKGWLAGVVLGAIALVFVFWGINWTMSAPDYAVKVNGSEIASSEVRQAYQQQLAQATRQSNGTVDDAQRSDLKRRVLDEYVNTEAVVTRADSLGYRVSDQDLLKAMAEVPAFQVDGKFDRAHAVAVLRAQGRSVAEIEELFRRDVKLRQLDNALKLSSFATPAELRQVRSIVEQEREVSWLTLSAAKYAAGATADEAQLKSFYDAHRPLYMTPETVNLRYVELSLSQLESKVPVDDAQLRAFYDEQRTKTPERFAQPEQRRVSHILLQVTDPKQDAAVKATAESLLKRIQGGEDFAKLAKQFSQDTGSAAQGGDLGWSERKVWVPPFAEAAFAMKEGEVRGPVKTQFGYHILKLDGVQPVTVRSFEQAKGDLSAEYRRSEAERAFNSAQDQLADAALQNTTDLDVVARKAGLVVQNIANFSRGTGGGELGASAPVISSAFSTDVLDGHLSPMVEMEKGRGIVMQASDHKLPQQQPFEAVRAEVLAAWRTQRGAELAAQAAAEAVRRLSGGEAWDAVVRSEAPTIEGAVQPPKFLARADQSAPAEVRRAAFEAPKPQPKQAVYRQVALANGDVDVLALTAVRENPSANPQEQEPMFRRQLAQQAAAEEAQGYALAARAVAKVSVNAQALD